MDKSCGDREFFLPHSQQGGSWVWDFSLLSLPLCIPQGDEGIVGMRGPPGMMVSVPEKKNTDPRLAKSPRARRGIKWDSSSGKWRFGNLDCSGMREWISCEFLTVLVPLGGSSQGLGYQSLPAFVREFQEFQGFQALVPLEGRHSWNLDKLIIY